VTTLRALGAWLDRYTKAWASNDAETIAALFTEDATYRWHPWEEQPEAVGRQAIVDAWLEDPDEPNAWTLECEPLAVNGDLGVARCITVYDATPDEPETTYHNIFLVRLAADGRASEFTEYFMKEPPPEAE
jgi:uncharacterized protein (TIGR02246 family)